MNAIIFSAGLGTRLKPLTDTIPKALVPLAGKPLLQWQVEKLRDAGITDIVVNVHHFPDQIIEAIHAHNGWGCSITVSEERDCLLDTGGGLRKAQGLFRTKEPVLACNVDILSTIDIKALMEAYDPQTTGVLVVSERKTQRYLLFDEKQTLRGWTNIATGEVKPESLQRGRESAFCTEDLRPLAFSGMQILNPHIFECMDEVVKKKGDKFSLIDLYLSLCEKETFKAYVPENYRMMDVGKIDQIAEAEAFAESI